MGFVCGDCGRRYKLKSSLRNHRKFECQKSPQFKCDLCSYKAKQRAHLVRHIKRHHCNSDMLFADSNSKGMNAMMTCFIETLVKEHGDHFSVLSQGARNYGEVENAHHHETTKKFKMFGGSIIEKNTSANDEV
nr:unnamed protein product [Callosobruchus chinensis]